MSTRRPHWAIPGGPAALLWAVARGKGPDPLAGWVSCLHREPAGGAAGEVSSLAPKPEAPNPSISPGSPVKLKAGNPGAVPLQNQDLSGRDRPGVLWHARRQSLLLTCLSQWAGSGLQPPTPLHLLQSLWPSDSASSERPTGWIITSAPRVSAAVLEKDRPSHPPAWCEPNPCRALTALSDLVSSLPPPALSSVEQKPHWGVKGAFLLVRLSFDVSTKAL